MNARCWRLPWIFIGIFILLPSFAQSPASSSARDALAAHWKNHLKTRPQNADVVVRHTAAPTAMENVTLVIAHSNTASDDAAGDAILVAKGLSEANQSQMAAELEKDSAAKIGILKQGIDACTPALEKDLVTDQLWAELCLLRSQLAHQLGNEYFLLDRPDDMKQSFQDALHYAEKARDAKAPHKKPADVWLALGKARECLAQFARIDVAKNFEEAAKMFDRAGAVDPDSLYNAGRTRFRWATNASPALDEAKKDQLFKTALLNLGGTAANKNNPHAAEASYWEGMTFWYLANQANAIRSFEQCMTLAQKNEDAASWAKWSMESIVKLARTQFKTEPERAAQWIEEAERAYRTLKMKKSPVFHGADQLLNDVNSEALLALAKKALLAKDFVKFKTQSDRAIELKHSTKGHEIAAERALHSKLHKTQLDLTSQNLTVIFEQTIAAIEGMANLNNAQKQKERSVFETSWSKIP